MKHLFFLFIWLCITNVSYAYTPSDVLEQFLETKVEKYELMIDIQWETMRTKLVSALQQILDIAPDKNYRNIEQEKFVFIISFLRNRIEENDKKTLTVDDFPGSYEGFVIVQYPDQIVATVRNTWPFGQTNDDSFQNLAGFIFGDNTSSTEIAMTSPVTRTQLDETTYETAFIMPSGWTMDSLPIPNNERITIKTIPWSLKAVRKFSGRVSKDVVDTQRELFQNDLVSQWVERYGLPTLSQYDGPRVAGSSRRNELWVELNREEWVF